MSGMLHYKDSVGEASSDLLIMPADIGRSYEHITSWDEKISTQMAKKLRYMPFLIKEYQFQEKCNSKLYKGMHFWNPSILMSR